MSEGILSKIKLFLDGHNIKYVVSVHAPVFTSEEAAKIRGAELSSGAKAMIMRSKGNFFMFVLPGDKKMDLRKVKQILGTDRLSFASSDEALKITDCVVGSIPPFGNIFNIPVYVDVLLLRNEFINFNGGLHTHSIQMRCKDYIAAVNPIKENFVQD